MIFFAESLLLFIAFYLIGSLELRGRAETKSRAFTLRTLLALAAALLLIIPIIYDTITDLPLVLLFLLVGLTALLAVITLLDIETKMLSDALTVILGLGGITYSYLTSETLQDILPGLGLGIGLALLGTFLAGPYSRWRRQEMLGWGDVKFFAAAGFWLVPLQLPIFLAVAGLIGAVNAMIYKVVTGEAQTPFAPALCAALWLCVAYGLSL